jgi:beta-lactamase class A
MRRTFLSGLGAVAGTAGWAACDNTAMRFDDEISAIEAKLGGRFGVMALDTGSGARLAHREDERFAMASTFKWLLAAFLLAKVDRGEITLDQREPYGAVDLLPHAPVTKAHLAEGGLGLGQLVEAAVEVSDNGAANLLLKRYGGPAALTAFLRSIGDDTTRLDRIEMALNSNLPGDPRDTTTPAAMVATMRKVLLGEVLAPASRERLVFWLKGCQTGQARLRAGFPKGWVAGDKTGTGENAAINDLAIAWPPGDRRPVLVACYTSGSKATLDAIERAQARIGGLVAASFA